MKKLLPPFQKSESHWVVIWSIFHSSIHSRYIYWVSTTSQVLVQWIENIKKKTNNNNKQKQALPLWSIQSRRRQKILKISKNI